MYENETDDRCSYLYASSFHPTDRGKKSSTIRSAGFSSTSTWSVWSNEHPKNGSTARNKHENLTQEECLLIIQKLCLKSILHTNFIQYIPQINAGMYRYISIPLYTNRKWCSKCDILRSNTFPPKISFGAVSHPQFILFFSQLSAAPPFPLCIA